METAKIEVNNHEQFRRVCLISSLICSGISGLIVALDPPSCAHANLMNGVYITLSCQVAIFMLLLMHYIHCGCLIRKLGWSLGFFYLILVGLMCWAQVIFFEGNGCGDQAFVLYFWLLFNIVIFFIFVAYGISLWGAYICWAQEEEEEIMKEALKFKYAKMVQLGEADNEVLAEKKLLMIEN